MIWGDFMAEVNDMIKALFCHDSNYAYMILKDLIELSNKSDEVYKYFDEFATMLDNTSSYVRTRGIALISANAKWDKDNKIDGIIDKYLSHVLDVKPVTSRQCVKAIPQIVKYKPELSIIIVNFLVNVNLSRYKDSMRPLIYKDIENALKEINEMRESHEMHTPSMEN